MKLFRWLNCYLVRNKNPFILSLRPNLSHRFTLRRPFLTIRLEVFHLQAKIRPPVFHQMGKILQDTNMNTEIDSGPGWSKWLRGKLKYFKFQINNLIYKYNDILSSKYHNSKYERLISNIKNKILRALWVGK